MNFPRLHPFISVLLLAIILIFIGFVIVVRHSLVPTTNTTNTWGGSIPVDTYTPYGTTGQTPQQIVAQLIQYQPGKNLTIPPLATSTPGATQPAGSQPFDYVALLSQITASANVKNPQQPTGQSPQDIFKQAYAYIPQGLVATTAPPTKPMTAAQKILYTYGNNVGSLIQSFETEHPNEAQILKNQVEDRADSSKGAAVVSLGKSLVQIGTQMKAMSGDEVPQSVSSMHAALAQSYIDIGTKLQLVPAAQSDSDFVAAIKGYDATADIFTRNYASLAAYFSLSGVTFSPQDPGSVFSFTQ